MKFSAMAKEYIDKKIIFRLADCAWGREGCNTTISGATGTCKIFLACAFGQAAWLAEFQG